MNNFIATARNHFGLAVDNAQQIGLDKTQRAIQADAPVHVAARALALDVIEKPEKERKAAAHALIAVANVKLAILHKVAR